MFGHVVAIGFFARGPVVSRIVCKKSFVEPMVSHNLMFIDFSFLRTLSLPTPSAVVLSVCIGVGG